MSNYPDLRKTLIALSGQQNVIIIHRPFVEFTGSLLAAMLLGQLLYWTPRAKDGWIAKTDKDWQQELCLSRNKVREGRKTLESMGILETKVKKFSGSPTVHYQVLWEELESSWHEWLNDPIAPYRPKQDDGSSQGGTIDCPKAGRSSIEITTEITEEGSQHQPSTVDVGPAVPDDTIPFCDPPIQEIDMAEEEPINEEVPKRAPKNLQPPGVKVFRSVTRRFPRKSWWAIIDRIVGTDEKALEKWKMIILEWEGHGWNPLNVKDMLEAYRKGGIKPRAVPADDSMKGWVCWDN